MVLGKLPVPGRPTIWMLVGHGPTSLAVGAGGGVWTFLLLSFLSSFSLSLGEGQTFFLSSITSLFFLPLSGRRPDID